jgi:hypothetical protein
MRLFDLGAVLLVLHLMVLRRQAYDTLLRTVVGEVTAIIILIEQGAKYVPIYSRVSVRIVDGAASSLFWSSGLLSSGWESEDCFWAPGPQALLVRFSIFPLCGPEALSKVSFIGLLYW